MEQRVFLEKLDKLVKTKYNRDLSELNCKSLMNIVRHNSLREELYSVTGTNDMGEGLFLLMKWKKEKPKCYCGNPVKFINFTLGYHEYCSTKCMTNSDKVKSKSIKTFTEHFGTKYGLQSEEVKSKSRKTWTEKYGVDNPSKSADVKKRLKEKSLNTFRSNFYELLLSGDRLGGIVKPLFTLEEYSVSCDKHRWLCLECGTEFEDNMTSGKIPRCPSCNKDYRSKFEKEIADWLLESGIEFTNNDRSVIYPLELDFVIPSKKIAIEFDGLYWHSEVKNSDRGYHLNKTEKCEEKGYALIHVFEDEWRDKKDIVKSVILSKMGKYSEKIFARKCHISKLKYSEAREFLEKNHLQGAAKSSVNIGLSYDGDLVLVCTFCKSRFNKKYDYELLRFCSKLNTQVIGGLSRCVSAFYKMYPESSIVSYADKRYSAGKAYTGSRWKLVSESPPNYWYSRFGHKYSRMQFQKHKLKEMIGDSFDPSLTEWQNMQLAGYDRIWDCGSMVFEQISSDHSV